MYQSLVALVFLLASTVNLQAQPGYFSIKKIRKDDLTFPIFSGGRDSVSTQKINQLLQLGELQIINEQNADKLFNNVVSYKDGVPMGMVGLSYVTSNKNARVLSVTFNLAASGATMYYWNNYYNFNPATGDLIQLRDLFTTEGFKAFNEMVKKRRLDHFSKQEMTADTSWREGFAEVKDCLANDNLQSFFIQDTAIYFDGDHCLRKDQKFIGLDMIPHINLHSFKDYLNPYGNAVFGITTYSIAQFKSSYLPQLFYGTIDSIPVVMFLNSNEGRNYANAIYAYQKYGKGIALSGTTQGDKIKLTEQDADYKDAAYFNLTYIGQTLTGTWVNAAGTKTRKVVLARK